MSKKNKKGRKKTDDVNTIKPVDTMMQVIFGNYLQIDSLTLTQQKSIVSALSLRNDSLYHSMNIDIITDILRYFKQLSLTAIQSEHVYYIVQNLLYKLTNDQDCNLIELTTYLHKQLSQRIKPDTDPNHDAKSDTQPNSESTEYISSEISEKIICFLEQRILSQYQLYRIALFENNPSNIKYIQFQKEFEIDDVIKFQDKDCMFKVAEFRPNDIVVHCLHVDFKSINPEDDKEKDISVNYYVSRDQLQFISFVSKAEQDLKVSQEEKVNNPESAISNENKDTSNKENKENDEKIEISEPTNEATNKEKADTNNVEPNKVTVIKECPKTLIDVIVDRKVQDKLKLMQQKFDAELEQYKQQIDLNNSTRSDML